MISIAVALANCMFVAFVCMYVVPTLALCMYVALAD